MTLSTSALAQEAAKPAKESGTPMMVSFTDLKWVELPERKGMQFAVLSGDPKKGEYTQMRKVPAGTANPVHTHSGELKNVIISGVWYTGADSAFRQGFRPRVDRDDASCITLQSQARFRSSIRNFGSNATSNLPM